MSWGYQDILGQKNYTRQISNIHKDFELYQIFMHNFLCQNFLIFPLQILLKRTINIFWSEGVSTYFGLEVSRQFGIENHQQKSAIFKKFFWTISSFHEQSYMPNYPKILILFTTQTAYFLTNPVLLTIPNYLFPA